MMSELLLHFIRRLLQTELNLVGFRKRSWITSHLLGFFLMWFGWISVDVVKTMRSALERATVLA